MHLPGNHITRPLSRISLVTGCLILLNIAVLGLGISEKFATCFRAFSECDPDTRITATPHFPCPSIKYSQRIVKIKNKIIPEESAKTVSTEGYVEKQEKRHICLRFSIFKENISLSSFPFNWLNCKKNNNAVLSHNFKKKNCPRISYISIIGTYIV